MIIDDAIERLSSCHPITEEDKETFECAVQCMQFIRDFLPLGATPERVKEALHLLNSLEYAMKNADRTGGRVYFTSDPGILKGSKANANRIAEAVKRTKKYIKRI
jgi:hypothetical protein